VSTVIVKGRPASVGASSRTRRSWQAQIESEARQLFATPLQDSDLRITITFFYNALPDSDTDNISKPICDALKGIAYNDDCQLMERNARRRDINGSFQIKGIDPEVAVALAEGEDFVAIEVEKIGGGVILI